jgi:FAD/FMN-containing dehydrogenase
MIDEGWSDSLLVWNGVVASVPALVLRPASPRELAAAIAFARDHDLRFTVGRGEESDAEASSAERTVTVELRDDRPTSL